MDQIKQRKKDPFLPQLSYAQNYKDVKLREAWQNDTARRNSAAKLAKSIEINKQNQKLLDRLYSIHTGGNSPLSKRSLSKKNFHPGASSSLNRKGNAQKIDIENQRLLRAIVQ